MLEAHENQELGPLRRLFLEGVMIGFYTMAGLVLGGARSALRTADESAITSGRSR